MIKELESIMTVEELNNKNLFPNYIIVCKPLTEGRDSQTGEMGDEWNGLLKEIEKNVKRQFENTNLHQKKMISGIESDIQMLESKFN